MDLLSFSSRLEHLRRIAEHLTVDMRTTLPAGGIEDRIAQIVLIEREITNALVSDEYGELLDAYEGSEPWVAVARRDREVRTAIGTELGDEFADVTLNSRRAWLAARDSASWGDFAPWLGRVVDMNLKTAAALGYGSTPHDSLLSVYETGPSQAQLDRVFDEIRPVLIDLNAERPVPNGRVLTGSRDWLPVARRVVSRIGFDLKRGAVVESDYPYTNPGGPNDVRVTLTHGPGGYRSDGVP